MIIDGIRHILLVAKFGYLVTQSISSDLESILSSLTLPFMPPPPLEARQWQIILAAAYLVNVIGIAATLYASPLYWKQEYHNSKLRGEAWVEELIHGHPDRIRTELGMRLHVFLAFVEELWILCGLGDGQHVSLKEQAAIFLYMSVTGLSIQHVGERFQRSNETISKYFYSYCEMYPNPIDIVGVLHKSLAQFHQGLSMRNMSSSHIQAICYQSTFVNPDSAPGLTRLLVPWTGHISTVVQLRKTDTQPETGKVVYPNTALPVFRLL